MDDRELIHIYLEKGSDTAFAELVRRHVDLVYSTALRRIGESQLAKDVSQFVFIRLARKASAVREGNALAGWLYRATCYEAASMIRSEQRRRRRETEAISMFESDADPSAVWGAVKPVLDEAMRKLGRVDQDAVVLRFFDNKSLREVAQQLGLTEEAARKRISRALDTMRNHFARRGITMVSATLASALAAGTVQTAPVGLAAALTSTSLAAGATAGITALSSTVTQSLIMTKTTAAVVTSIPDFWLLR